MEFRDPSNNHPHLYRSPAAQFNPNQHQQPSALLSQPYSSSSSSFSYLPNPNPNPNSIHGLENPLPSSAAATAAPDALRTPGVDPYCHDPYASHSAYDGAHSIPSQSWPQTMADYYYLYQLQQQGANSLTYGVVGTGNTAAELEIKRRKVIAGGAPPDAVRTCLICNVVCNSDKVFALHLAGEKHALKAFGIPSNALKLKVPAHTKVLRLTNKATHPAPRMAPKTPAKKASRGLLTFVASSYCDVCKVDCNSQEVLSIHKQGKKHIRNLQKLQEAIMPKPANAPTKNVNPIADPSASENKAVNEQPKQNAGPVIQEDLESRKQKLLNESDAVNEQPKQNAGAATKENLETKKQKVLNGGVAADAVRVCGHCNVVCNSQVVYDYHIAGKKHIAMMNKMQQAAPVS